MIDTSTVHLVGIALPTLRGLRAAVLASDKAEDAVAALRQAGFAGGDAVYGAFERWLGETAAREPGSADAAELSVTDFSALAARFFRDAGWGAMEFRDDESDEGVATVEIAGCWEGALDATGAGCHVTTGLLASFFGRIAGYPVAVLETGCSEGDERKCRFLLGNEAMMNYRWEQISRGYTESSASA